MIELDTHAAEGAKIRVIGVGGGGGNAINNMIRKGLSGVDFIAANTDKQALSHNLAPLKIQVGKETTRGLGAGAKPEVGKQSVEEAFDEIKEFLRGSDMIFVTSGMGGGTGTGGAPIIARIGQELGSLVVGIVTKPFLWEGKKRLVIAEDGIRELKQFVDALIVIPNQKLLDIIDKNTSFGEAFEKVDEVLYNATRGIADIIANHGRVNVDFADVRTIMKGMGDALMGIGTGTGENRAAEATHNALNSPLLDGISIAGAQGVLVNVTGGIDMGMREVAEAVTIVENATGSEVNLIHGVVYRDEPSEEISVTVVATGFAQNQEKSSAKAEEKLNPLKSKSVTIPYVKNTETHGYTKPSVLFGGKSFISVENAKDGNGNGTHPVITPRGENELRKLDIPAFERRPMRQAMVNMSNLDKPDEPEIDETNEYIESQVKNLEKPAFLRKIMD